MRLTPITSLPTCLVAVAGLAVLVDPSPSAAQESNPFAPPTRAWEQGAIYKNSVPTDFETHILAETDAELEIAQRVLDIYEIFVNGATNENLAPYISDEYIQHSVFLPNGRAPLAELFGGSVEERDISIDIHRIIVSGNYAFAHVNFRNLDHDDPRDLGIAAVDMYRFDEETGLLEEHWDVLQNVPSHSPNPNTMFLLAD
ncbi:MAG: nuclear transport factor 2 family protein [Pseudomonadota bacterium]